MLPSRGQAWKGALNWTLKGGIPAGGTLAGVYCRRSCPFSVDVRGRAAGTETPAAQSIAGARDFQMDIRNGSGFHKRAFWMSTGENTDVQVKYPSLEAEASPPPDLLEIF